MIEISSLCKKLGNKTVLCNVESRIQPGSIYGLIGSNGAGKSTLLNLIDGVYKPDLGVVKVFGRDVYENIEAKNRIAYIADDPFYFNSYTMNEMAGYLDAAYPSFSMDKFNELIQLFPLNPKDRINTFSKGMKRQAAIVFALSQSPDILLCDECFDGLDPVIRQLVKKLFINEVTERNMTVVISSHSLRELENLCDVVGILHDNRIIMEKSLDDIKNRLHKFQLAFKPMIDLEMLPEDIEIIKTEVRGNIIELVARGESEEISDKLSRLNPVISESMELTLEDIFIYEMEASGYDFSKLLV